MQMWTQFEEADEIDEQEIAVERLARSMAQLAGVCWDKLDYHPGFERGRWRDDARTLMRTLQSQQQG